MAAVVARDFFRISRRLICLDITKPSYGFGRGGLTLVYLPFRPHLPFGKTTLLDQQVGEGVSPTLDVPKSIANVIIEG